MNIARPASHAIFAFGVIGAASWGWWQLELLRVNAPDLRCGLPIMGIYGTSILGAAMASLLATCLNWRACRRLPRPRPRARSFEIAVLALPAAIAVALFATLLLAG